MLHCWSFEGFQTPSPVSCGPSAILHEPWATAKEVNWGVMNKVPNQNANPTVTALINLGGFNDLLATQQLAEPPLKLCSRKFQSISMISIQIEILPAIGFNMFI